MQKILVKLQIEIEVDVNARGELRVSSAKWPTLAECGQALQVIPLKQALAYCDVGPLAIIGDWAIKRA